MFIRLLEILRIILVIILVTIGCIAFWYVYTSPALVLDIIRYDDYYHNVHDFIDIIAYTMYATLLWLPILFVLRIILYIVIGKWIKII